MLTGGGEQEVITSLTALSHHRAVRHTTVRKENDPE
jgi:hypothetical protein